MRGRGSEGTPGSQQAGIFGDDFKGLLCKRDYSEQAVVLTTSLSHQVSTDQLFKHPPSINDDLRGGGTLMH